MILTLASQSYGKRVTWLTVISNQRFLVALLALLLAVALDSHSRAENKPNIVVFLTDDLGLLDSEPYGATDVRTPNMKQLAEVGMTFTHAFVASPSCAPSRAALLTGLMPARNGAEANHSFKRDDVPSLTENLRALGYELAAFGKVAHGKDAVRHRFDKISPKHDQATIREYLKSRDVTQPLCLFVGTHDPHVPWPTMDGYDPTQALLPPTFIDTPLTREFRAKYYADVTRADRDLGEVRELAAEFLGEDSLFIFSSDHGAQWPFGKWNLYDSGIRVPLIVSWPGRVGLGSQSQAMVQWIDVLPTLIEAAGGDVPVTIDGRSFLSNFQSENGQHRDVVFTTHSGDGRMNVYPIRSIRTRDWKLIWNLHPEFAYTTHIDKALAKDGGRYWISWYEAAKNSPSARAIVDRYHRRPQFELYDLQNDPFETVNLIESPEHVERIRELKGRLESWMAKQDDQRTVFAEPRLLSDPESTLPGKNSNAN